MKNKFTYLDLSSLSLFLKEEESVKSFETKIKAFVLIFTIKDILVF